MGTLTGHLLPGAAFTLLGLWHLVNTAASYRLSGPSTFSSRTWFPSPFIKHLELLLLLLLSLLSSTVLLFLSSSSSPSDLEHASMFLHLFIYSSAALAADLLPSPSSSAIVGALAASAFAQELLLLHFHSIDHSGLEGHYHSLMEIVVATCLVSTAATVGFPASYVAAVVRSAAVALQGMWFVCMGLVLWGPERLLPAGCAVNERAVVCADGGAAASAAAAANVQFSWMVAGVAAITAAICLVPEGKEVEYRKLGNVGKNPGEGDGGGGVKMVQASCFICLEKGAAEERERAIKGSWK
ncbi:hypothetical protein M5K25_022857 [Dendrobium thyrsiflorum]|uniref:Uncharacterized protein n=1 Tax=Dendrobium thyrsiflorum TaxID=117978 RepID=A0ABD0UDE7_DENTH